MADIWKGDGSINDPHALNVVPGKAFPSPDQITLRINIGCTSRIRQTWEAFQPTITYTAPFLYTTNLQDYATLVPTIAQTVYSYVADEQLSGAIVETHVQLWLDNVTHPDVAAGVVRLPKGSRDTQLSNEDFSSAQVLEDHLNGNILDIKNTARY